MIELVLIYCLASDAERCMERREMVGRDLSPIECIVQAQTVGQEWVGGHPQWRLSGWRCERDVPRQTPT